METLSDLLYDEKFLANHSLSDVCDHRISFDIGDEPKDWNYVRARAGVRGNPLFSQGIYVILRTKKYRSLKEELGSDHKDTAHYTSDEIIDAMPRKERRFQVVPSRRGEYMTINEVRAREMEDGRIEVERSAGHSSDIPVEFVIEPLSYDEVVVELIEDVSSD